MSRLLVRSQQPDDQGCVLKITPESAGWRYVGFEVYKLQPGQVLNQASGDEEVCLVLISGIATVRAQDQVFEHIGKRMSVFERIPPYAVYVPAQAEYQVTAETEIEIGVCKAPAKGTMPVRLIKPEDVPAMNRGQGTNERYIHNILMGENPAESLLITEVYTPNGHWSSYPPHKHDSDNLPQESYLEETYYHKVNPPQGFAFQRVYTDDRSIDETLSVHNNEVVLVPGGYHPVGAPHGYDLYYLNVMAGPSRDWKFHNDPDHEWILQPK
ncbi:5-deoxyglucuronate isomerase [Pokkaliibacter plantistimulans]|uniref:5-deoxyglucuronate isomerase n=1 Tax=Pokkaliibacter plantistimulans TaxID=1635171 RepID=A0ABX5LQG2_9GAMM|nr:5-deoxy-glucuronate isomerase [Pokkaliibacter plantistimulans]PXF28909.1 5-deoxyglucuronate isomerase [Pokkaliibacter plantistimulans]